MGVDFLICRNCQDTFPDCGFFVRCNDGCWSKWCSNRCAEEDGFARTCSTCGYDPTVHDEEDYSHCEDKHEEYDLKSCKYCRGEDATDTALLTFALNQLSLTRDQLLAKYRASRK